MVSLLSKHLIGSLTAAELSVSSNTSAPDDHGEQKQMQQESNKEAAETQIETETCRE